MTLEDQFQLRKSVIFFLYQLTEELEKTLKLFYEKWDFARYNDMADYSIFTHLQDAIRVECWNICERAQKAQTMAKEGLLPISEVEPTVKLQSIMVKVFNIRFEDTKLQERHLALCKVAGETLKQLARLQSAYIESEEETITVFTLLKKQYRIEHEPRLRCYIEDIASVQEAKATLRREEEKHWCVKCWNDNGRDLLKTMEHLRDMRIEEKELLILLDYVSKYDMLQELPKESAVSYHFHEGSQNVEKIDNQIIKQ
ncbi:MAG: hypothetical protein MJZ62_07280 [Bacteroidales bacterium]|nr:hypothetical protein [Bacteroidales bacterium]